MKKQGDGLPAAKHIHDIYALRDCGNDPVLHSESGMRHIEGRCPIIIRALYIHGLKVELQ
jgi:hypothetical protein